MRRPVFLRRWPVARRLAVLAAAVVTVVPMVWATTSCSTSLTLSGTVRGSDGRYVDVMIGFDIRDAAGKQIRVDGGVGGYSMIKRVNYCLPASGSATGPLPRGEHHDVPMVGADAGRHREDLC